MASSPTTEFPRIPFPAQGTVIFQAERAYERLLRQRIETPAVIHHVDASELRELASHMAAVLAIAKQYHLERAELGSITDIPGAA